MTSPTSADWRDAFGADSDGLECLDDETVVALAEGALHGEARAEALRHVESCPICSALVGQAARLGNEERTTLGRYRVMEEIGAGGMGRVYAAYDPSLDREVAVKVLHVESLDAKRGSARLRREAQTLAGLNHPTICKVFDVQEIGEAVFIAMELVRGKTFASWSATRPSPDAILGAFVRAGEGLAAAHAAGIVHRDFKPSNAMIDDDGRVVVLDFGLARRKQPVRSTDDTHHTTGHDLGRRTSSAVAGTPIYMAPEQYDGIATPASDQYAFCLALAEALLGRFPFAGLDAHQLRRAKLSDAPAVDGLPARVRAIVRRGLHPDPRARWPDMLALLRALQTRSRRRWPLVAAPAALVILGAMYLATPEIDCDRADARVTNVWNDARRDALREAFEVSDALEVGKRVDAALEAHAEAIAAAYRDACTTARGGSDALFDARARCLDRRLQELEAASAALDHLDTKSGSSALTLLEELTPVDRCLDSEFLLAMAPIPDDPRVAARVAHVEGELEKANAEVRIGRYREVLPMFERVLDDARMLEHDPLVAEALTGLAVILRKLDDPRAADVAEEAHVAARLVRDAESATTAAIELAHITRRQGRLAEASQWVERAELEADRSGVPRLRAHAIEAKAAIAYAKNELEQALALQREAAELHASIDPDGRQHALAVQEVATTLRRLERFDESLELLAQSRALMVALYGEQSPRLAEIELEVATVHLVRGEPEAAIPYFERGIDLVARKSGEHSRAMLAARTGLAAAFRDAGRLDEAAEQSRRAIAVLDHVEHGPREAAVAWLHYGETLALRGELAEALEAFDKSRTLLEEMEENAAQRDLLRINLEQSAEVRGRIKEAR